MNIVDFLFTCLPNVRKSPPDMKTELWSWIIDQDQDLGSHGKFFFVTLKSYTLFHSFMYSAVVLIH